MISSGTSHSAVRSSGSEEHRAVHAALVSGDPDAATARMREHIENAKTRVLNDRKAVMNG
ncbi:FCD domain-containing protein [Kibdelosporangium aridum]|uniref:FCD domain-containing protein n=1 Tax=Kibdelosporangium aridum TaxID=2030 RepID=UPI0037BE274F